MDKREDNEQPKPMGQNQVLEELLRTNQQMMRQGKIMMDMMQQVMRLHLGGRRESLKVMGAPE